VKMAPVVRRLGASAVEARLCVTAQHRQMLDPILKLFEIQPDYDLDVMRDDQSLADLSAAVLLGLDKVLSEFSPDWVLVQGDTTTVAISALLAYYRRTKVGHVEAGLRTGDKWQPFPEEVNRRVAGAIADLHFAPTAWARDNLLREGIDESAILITGNPGIDAVQHVAGLPRTAMASELLDESSVGSRQIILVTAHRRENFGEPLANICSAIRRLGARSDVQILYPVHLNPNVREPVHRMLQDAPNVTLLPPLDYQTLVHIMKRARLILTDSGGIQEEAAALGVPSLVMRALTERPEGVQAGILRLVGTDEARIVTEANRLLDDEAAHAAMSGAPNPFGDGHAAERIVDALLRAPA